MCADSTNADDVARLNGEERVAMLWSDPPYGLGGYAGRGGSLTPVEGDDAGVAEIRSFFLAGIAPEIYVCCEYKTYEHLLATRGTPRSLIVWGKNVFGMGRGYRRQHEFIGYYGDFDSTTESDLWLESKDTDYIHPTQKPPTLARRAICNSTNEGDVVYAPFNGSGDAMVAAEQTNRICYGMEIEPKYCAVTLERLSAMGLEPTLIK